MNDTMLYLLGSYGVVLATVWLAATHLDDTLSATTKKAIAKSLRTADWTRTWPNVFIRLFDTIFGDKHLSWKCFRRSCYASLFMFGVMTLMALSIRPPDMQRLFRAIAHADALLVIVPLLMLANCLPDYLSLLETRWLLRHAFAASLPRQVCLLVLDILFTACIICAAFSLYGLGRFIFAGNITVDEPAGGSPSYLVAWHLSYITQVLTFRDARSAFQPGVLVYTTYTTSAWLWLFLLTSSAIRIVWATDRALRLKKPLFDVDRKPLRSLAIVACIGIALTFPLVLALYVLFS